MAKFFTAVRCSYQATPVALVVVVQPIYFYQQEMQQTQAKALITLDRSCFADLFALFRFQIIKFPFECMEGNPTSGTNVK